MYRKNQRKWMKHYDFMLIDIVCCIVSFLLANLIRDWSYFFYNGLVPIVLTLLVFCDLATIFLFEPFSGILRRGFAQEFDAVFRHVLYVFFIEILMFYVLHIGSMYSRIAIVIQAFLFFVMEYTSFVFWKRHLRSASYLSLHKGKLSLLILVEDNMADDIAKTVLNHNYENYALAGFCILDKNMKGETIRGVQVVANKDDVLEYVCREWVDEVMLVSVHTSPYNDLMTGFSEMGITQHIKINVTPAIQDNVNMVERVGPYTCLTSAIKVAGNIQLFEKRMLDIIGGLVGCMITLVLCVIFFPIVMIKSPGPLIYSSTRIGKNGKRFKFYKFRSMVVNADQLKDQLKEQNRVSDGMMFKIEHDPRIIPGYGEFIRKTSLDEFPQFFNVLIGDMSLVGTRPPTPDEWEKYKLHHRMRLSVKPGITGMWQTSGRSNITDFEEVTRLDSYYAHNWSMGLDIKLLWKTVLLVLKRDGSM